MDKNNNVAENMAQNITRPNGVYTMVSWLALTIGVGAFLIGMYNAGNLELGEKGFYISNLLLAAFAAASVQKNIRDRMESLPVSDAYYGLAWFCVIVAVAMFVIGMINVELDLATKGFYIMALTMTLYATVSVQKNVRDNIARR